MGNPLTAAADQVAKEIRAGKVYVARDGGWSLAVRYVERVGYVLAGTYDGPTEQLPGPMMVGGGVVKRGNGASAVVSTPEELLDTMAHAAPLGRWEPEAS